MKRHVVELIAILFLFGSCVYHDLKEPVNCNDFTLLFEVVDTVNASVCGATDGSLTASISGGQKPYTFSINDQPEQSDSVFGNLSSGFYSITAYDKNRCRAQLDSVLISVDQFLVTFNFEPDDECLDDSGSMEVIVTETNGPYQFKLDQGVFTSSNVFENLKHGNHFLTIQDNDGCNVSKLVTVPRGITGISWQNDILPIMTTSCAVTGCHNGVSRPNDWRIYSHVKLNASTIRKKTQDRSMPFDTTLPQDQIDMIACWIDDGAPEN